MFRESTLSRETSLQLLFSYSIASTGHQGAKLATRATTTTEWPQTSYTISIMDERKWVLEGERREKEKENASLLSCSMQMKATSLLETSPPPLPRVVAQFWENEETGMNGHGTVDSLAPDDDEQFRLWLMLGLLFWTTL